MDGTFSARQQKGHNHPSGNSTPSTEDLTTTAHIMRAGKILCLPVLDHIIVTRHEHCYHSMFERGTLPNIDE
ncbi:MAG: JAB domain-containing protein [Polyangiaceae bacterium]